MLSPYCTISSRYWLVNDKPRENLLFHVEKGDYFGTLATILSLIAEGGMTEWAEQSIRKAKEDLVYLQKNYKITKK